MEPLRIVYRDLVDFRGVVHRGVRVPVYGPPDEAAIRKSLDEAEFIPGSAACRRKTIGRKKIASRKRQLKLAREGW